MTENIIRRNSILLPNHDWNGLYSPENYSDLKVLIFGLGKRQAYRPFMFSSNEIYCSPDTTTEYSANGQPLSLQSPVGRYDIKEILDKLPSGWKPDMMVLKMDGTRRNIPVNTDQLKCTKVFIVGAPHHLFAPVRCLLEYLKEEQFDFFLADHDRHHLHFFAEAGFSNGFWLPAINIYPHLQPEECPITHNAAFIGNVGRFHPYRRHIVDTLKQHKCGALIARLPHDEAAAAYASSHVSINCSLNGDMNLRVFEIISSGGFLLTDKLAPASGLEMLFDHGKEFDSYGSAEELTEKLDYYTEHPEQAAEIAAAGFKRFWKEHDPRLKLKQFYDFVLNGKLDDERYSLSREPRCTVPVTTDFDGLLERTAKYEFLQELQLYNRYPQVVTMTADIERLVWDITDLPRLTIYTTCDSEQLTADASKKLVPLSQCSSPPPVWNCLIIDRKTLDSVAAAPSALEQLFRNYPFDSLMANACPDRETIDKLEQSGLSMVDNGIPFFRWKSLVLPSKIFIAEKSFQALEFLRENYSLLYDQSRIDFHAGKIWTKSEDTYDIGIKFLKRHLSANRLEPETLEILINHELSHNNINMAAEYLEDLLQGSPDNWESMNQLAGIYMQTENYAEAFKWYSRSLEINADQEAIAKRLQRLSRRVTPAERTPILPPSRILLITNLYPPQELGGYGRCMYNFTEELRKRGHNVEVLTSYLPSLGERPDDPPHVDRSIELYGDWAEGGLVHFDNPEQTILQNIDLVLKKIQTVTPDIILLGNLDMINFSITDSILEKFDIPVFHHLGFRYNPFPNRSLPKHPRYCLLGCSNWVMKQNVTKEDLNGDYVYPGGVTSDFFIHSPIATGRLNIVYASLVVAYKGIGTLINALCILKNRNIDFSCTVAGKILDTRYYEELLHVCKANRFSDQVKFVGNLDHDELCRTYAASNVLVFPSITPEPFGITPVEAMAAGLPVISTGTGGSHEVVEDNIDGIITEPDNHEKMAEALISLTNNPDRWLTLAATAQKRAQERFDITISIDKLEHLFKKALEQ